MIRLGTFEWPNEIGQDLMQVMNCCKRGGKQELVNASSRALNHHAELFLSTSGFVLLVQEGLPCLLCVALLCGAAAGQSAGHCCILCSGITGSSVRRVELGRAVSMAVQRGNFFSQFCVAALQGFGVYLKKNAITGAKV